MIFSDDTELTNIIAEIAVAQNFHDFQVDISTGSVKGDGYIGIINSAQVTGKDAAGKQKQLNLIVKSAKKSEAMREQVPVTEVFKVEMCAYDTILPIYKQMEEEKGLTPTKFAPKFYKGDTADKHEYLILENLKEVGYKLHERRYPMNGEHVRLVLEQYGKFHALSFALQNKNPAKFNEIKNRLGNVWIEFLQKTDFTNTIECRYKKALESLDPVIDKKALDICEAFFNKMKEFMMSIVISADTCSTIIHGDCWTNNMMFKYSGSTDDKPICVDFLDFQLMRVGSPVFDITYFFYTCSSKEVIDNFKDYLNIYYDSLKTHLGSLGCDAEKLYPYHIFMEQWTKYSKYGLLVAGLLIHAMLSEQNETIDMAEAADSGARLADMFNYDIANVSEYNNRMRNIMLHFVDNGYFD